MFEGKSQKWIEEAKKGLLNFSDIPLGASIKVRSDLKELVGVDKFCLNLGMTIREGETVWKDFVRVEVINDRDGMGKEVIRKWGWLWYPWMFEPYYRSPIDGKVFHGYEESGEVELFEF